MHAKFYAFLPRVILNYRPSDDTTLYISASKGNKPGIFNTSVANRPADEQAILSSEYGIGIPVDEASIWNYELGWKQLYRGRGGYSNISIYYMDWTDQQTRRAVIDPRILNGVPFSAIINAGKTKLYGVEVEGGLKVNEVWSVSATYALAKSEYVNFSSSQHEQVYGTADASGRELANNPEQTLTLSNTLHHAFSNGWAVRFNADILYEDSRWTDETNLTSFGERWRANARLGIESNSLRASLYVRNLFDDSATPSARKFSDIQLGGFAWEVLQPEKRVFGIDVDYYF